MQEQHIVLDMTLEKEKMLLAESERFRRQLIAEGIVNKSIEYELSLCRDIQKGVLESVFMVDRLWKLEFCSDQKLQSISGFEDEHAYKQIFTNGLIDAVFHVRDDGSTKFLFIKESNMNEMTIDQLNREGFRLRQDIADSYAELHEGWETIFQSGDVFSRFYRRTEHLFMYIGPYIPSDVERLKYERFMLSANLLESDCPREDMCFGSLAKYVWTISQDFLELARQKEATIYTVFEGHRTFRIRKGFWINQSRGYLMAKEQVDIGEGFLVHEPEV